MHMPKHVLKTIVVVLLPVSQPVPAVVNSAYADPTGNGGLTLHSVFPTTLNGNAGDVTGQVFETVVCAPVPSLTLSAASSTSDSVASGYADLAIATRSVTAARRSLLRCRSMCWATTGCSWLSKASRIMPRPN